MNRRLPVPFRCRPRDKSYLCRPHCDRYAPVRSDARVLDPIMRALVGVLLAPKTEPSAWYGAAEAAVATIYALHPRPGGLAAALVHHLAGPALGE